MPITINGLTGISGADGSAATPFITGSDTDTGLYFPSAGNAAISINGTRALLVDNSNNVTMTGNVTATEFRFANGSSILSAAAGIPTGAIINYPGLTAPAGGYLACDGTVYLRSSYGALANVIGTPAMPSSYTAEYANTTWSTSPIYIANGVAFASPGPISPGYKTSFLGGIYTSTDGTTWTARNAKPLMYSPTGIQVINVGTTYVATANIYPNQRVLAAFAAPNGGVGLTPNGGQILQTSTDLATWTARSITLAPWVGVPSGLTSMVGINNITTGGTVANRILLTMYFEGATFCACATVYASAGSGSKANTAVSDDYGVTWSFSNNLPATTGNANNSYSIQAASSNAGFVLTQSNVAFWSSNGQYWQDITANLRTALGVTSSSVSLTFYNVSQANNLFIIPTTGNRFLVAPSSNGSNGNWTTINVETNPSGAEYAASMLFFSYDKIIHNGSAYFYNALGSLTYSNDLRYWFKKDDLTYGSSTFSQYNAIASFPNGKLLVYSSAKTILSFTANGGYTVATQFPVPKISNFSSTYAYPAYGVSGTSVVPYIKT